uniref:TNFR-Cys domain-containing protein n=2 Tax=Panagrellus redivivus TaxID=6233 RepID=A0A7E4WEB2_PANRE
MHPDEQRRHCFVHFATNKSTKHIHCCRSLNTLLIDGRQLTMILSILLVFCLFGIAQTDGPPKLPGCLTLGCDKSVTFKTPVRACDECRNGTHPLTRFCAVINNSTHCINDIPQKCNLQTTPVAPIAQKVGHFCIIQKKSYLPLPAINQNKTIDISVPRFFESDKYEHLRFHSLNIQLYFEKDVNATCDSTTFTRRKSANVANCLWSMSVAMPVIDAKDTEGDAYYYDDQSELSLSFAPRLLPHKKNTPVSVWYRVQADHVIDHGNQQLNFSIPLYSYRKDVKVQ